jgi:hypothetical protein
MTTDTAELTEQERAEAQIAYLRERFNTGEISLEDALESARALAAETPARSDDDPAESTPPTLPGARVVFAVRAFCTAYLTY